MLSGPKCFTYKDAQPLIVQRALLSADPSECKDSVVLVMLRGYHKLAFCKSGDEQWTLLKFPHLVSDIIYFEGKFYAIDTYNRLSIWIQIKWRGRLISKSLSGIQESST